MDVGMPELQEQIPAGLVVHDEDTHALGMHQCFVDFTLHVSLKLIEVIEVHLKQSNVRIDTIFEGF